MWANSNLLTLIFLDWQALGSSPSPAWNCSPGSHFQGRILLAMGMLSLNYLSATSRELKIASHLPESSSLPWGLCFLCVCDVIILRGLRFGILQEHKTGGRDQNFKCKKQADLILPPLPPPFSLKGALRLTSYSRNWFNRIKGCERSTVISFLFLSSSLPAVCAVGSKGCDARYVPDANVFLVYKYLGPPCLGDLLSFSVTFLFFHCFADIHIGPA